MALDYSISVVPGEARLGVIEFAGRLDSESSQDLEAVLRAAVHRHRITVLDLSQVLYVSSAGWRAILRVVTRPRGDEQLYVAGMQPTVSESFDLLGFANIIAAHDDLQKAIGAARRAIAALGSVA